MAYSNSRYRHSPNLITSPQKIASIQTFPEIDAIEEIEPIYGFTSLTQKEQTYNRLQNNKITETFLSNYNDPKELNSYIDALTNREAVSEKFGEVWGTASTLSGTASILSFIGAAALGVAGIFTGGATLPAAATLAKIGAIAAIPSIPAAIDVTIEKNLKPLFAGKPKEAGLNLLMNLGETVDVIANPIKGLIQEGSEGFIKGTGLSDAGRVNYNYDTGSVITDMALELITDPLNWISFGGAAVIKTGTKTLSRTLTEDIVNNAVRATNAQITTEGLNIGTEGAARIFKTVSNATAKLAKDTLNINNKLDKEAQTTFVRTSIQRALVNALKKEVPTLTNTQISDILKQVTRNTRNGRYQKSAYTHIQNITLDQLSTDVLKGISAMQYYTDSFQNRLIKNSLFSSGFGIGMDLFKSNFDNIKTWMSNLTLNKLKPHNLFNENKGVDITRWDEVKAFWEVCSEYTNALTNEISPRDLDSLYMLLSEQLTRDKQLIKEILDTYNLNPIKQAGALDGIFKQLYGVEFREYIAQLKYINSVENNKYTEFIDYAEYIDKNILQTAYAKSSKVPIKTNAQLYSSKSLESFTKKQSKLVENISKVFSKKDININTNVDKLYVLKESNTYINDLLVNDPAISTAINEITSSEGVGIFLQKIKDDINAYNPEASAEILDAINTIERAGSTFANLKELHNNIAGLILPKIQGVSDSNFKRYIIDQIYGMYKPIDTLLIEFDSITMPTLMRNIEVYLKDKNFKVNDYPGLSTQIAEVYKRFLQAQQRANNTYTNTAIVQDFTTSIEFLLERYPQFANEFTNIRQANIAIKTLLKNVKNTNIDLFNNVFADYNTIFNITNTRKLSDIGLALRTLAEHDNLKYFNLPKNSNSATIAFAQRFGQTVNKYKQSIQQYYTYKNTKFLNNISIIYSYIIKNMVENSTDKIQYLSKEILKQDSITQLAILMAYKKYISQNKLEFNKFKNILNALVGRNKKLYNTIMYPDKFFITDFAWDAMKQSEWIAKKAFNEDLINGITAYDNLSTISSKITNDFKTIRDELSKNNLDTPKRLQQERFIKVASKYNKLLDFFEKYYNSLFDKELATKEIEELRGVLNNFPELNEKYSTLVDELEAYWRGEKTFQQSDKANAQLYNQARMELIQEYTSKNKGLRPDEEAMQIINARLYNEFGSQGIIDEFTPFWEKIKEMNDDIIEKLPKDTSYKIITPWDPVRKQQELNKAIYNATDVNSKDAFYKLFNLSSEELMQELAYRHRFITFKEEDINDKILKNLFKEFKNKNENKYIHFIYDAPTQRYWIVLDKSQEVMMDGRKVYLNGNLITRPRAKKQFNELQQVDNLITDPENPGITKLFNELDDSLFELTGSRLGDSQGEHFSKEMLEQVYEQMPDNVKTLLPEIDKLTDKQYFNSFIYNESVLGKTSSKASLGLYSGNLIVNMRNAVAQAQLYLKPKIEYVNTVFNSILSIASPNSVWKNFTDKELLEALQQTREYKLIALVYDKKYGAKVREIYPTNESAIAKARELGAVIVPLQTYKDMYNVVNHRLGSSGFAKLWNRIMYTYKFGYLIRPGAWIRNFIDTNLKSILEMGGEYKSYLEQSHRILNEYYNIRDYVQIRSEDGILKNEAIKEFFDLGMNNYLTYEQYLELNKTFFSQGVSGNIMADLYVDTDSDLWQSFTNITGKIIDSVNRTENYNRLAVYLYNLDKGMDTTSALARLSKVHFDYSFKNKTEQLLDMVFPFTTFTLRNYSYWIEMIEKHPWILANYAHLMAPHWDFQDYTPEQLATDYTAQNQILNGQLKLAEFEDKRIIFKANPSIQDAIDLFSDPINNIYEKLAAPISVPLNLTIGEYTQPTNLIPILGPAIQSLKSIQNTGSPLPSAIAITVNYNNPNYNGINGYKDKQYYRPNATKNVVYDSYKTKGITAYRTRMYPVVDIAFEVKSRYTTNVYNRIKNRVKQDVYKGIRYRIRTDTNRFR